MAAAKAAGVDISATSSFRTMAHQTDLYNQLGSARAAKPGTSNHQFGEAIDFNVQTSGSIYKGVGTVYNWLVKNAATFGMHNDSSTQATEAWHWSPSGN